MKNNIKINALIILGWIFVGLGFIGMLLPLMPSTVFFIAASYFFSRSSEKFNNWLLNHRLIGNSVRNFIHKKGMTFRTKVFAIGMLFITIICSIIISGCSPVLFFMLMTVAFGVSGFIISINTLKETVSPDK